MAGILQPGPLRTFTFPSEPGAAPIFSALSQFLHTLKASVLEWVERGVFHWGAALAFYSLFSLTPLLVLGVTAVNTVLATGAVRERVVEQAGLWLGSSAQEVVRQVVDELSLLEFDSVIVVPTALLLLLGATAVFANIQAALNDIWKLQPQSGVVTNLLRARLMAVAMLGILGATVVLSVLLTTGAQVVLPHLPESIAGTFRLGQLVEVGVTITLLWVLLGFTFQILPDAHIAWRDVWVGAAFTAVLLYLGKLVLGVYFGVAELGSAFGAAGSIFTLLVWIYYSAQIFFLGAIFTRIWADEHGASVRPESYASFIETRPVYREPEGKLRGAGEDG